MAIKQAVRPIGTPTQSEGFLILKAKNIAKGSMLEVTLKVFKGEKNLIASNRELGIVTEGKNWNSLMKNIREVIELYFDIPSADAVKIKLEIDPMVDTDAEKASC
jgi:hypothetical protein